MKPFEEMAFPVQGAATGWMQGSEIGGNEIDERVYLELTFGTRNGSRSASFVFTDPDNARRAAEALLDSVSQGPRGLRVDDEGNPT